MRKYGLTLKQVAETIRRENVELPGGTMRTDSQEVLLRGKNKRLVGTELNEIPLITTPGGVVLRVGDLCQVRRRFRRRHHVDQPHQRPARAGHFR